MNKPVTSPIDIERTVKTAPPALLFEMIRSFVTLARTLNLSHAVKELNSTRQTVRRHITALEDEIGAALFEVNERQYRLTPAGESVLPEAEDLAARARVWLGGSSSHINGLLRLSQQRPNGWEFHQQEQPLDHIWGGKSELLKEGLSAWAKSEGELESEHMAHLRPYLLVYRDTPNGWICVEIGEESFYTMWYGWSHARSSIGRPLGQLPGGDDFARLLEQSFDQIQMNSGVRLDEVVTTIPRVVGGPLIPTAYKRLLMGGRFPDGSFALIAVVDRSDKIRIDGVEQGILEQMPGDAVSTFVLG